MFFTVVSGMPDIMTLLLFFLVRSLLPPGFETQLSLCEKGAEYDKY